MRNVRKRVRFISCLAIVTTVSLLCVFENKIFACAANQDNIVPISVATTNSTESLPITKVLVSDVTTDKSMYNPGEKVNVKAELNNTTGKVITDGIVELNVKHLGDKVGSPITQTYSVNNGEKTDVSLSWTAPSQDFKGYLLEITCRDSTGTIVDSGTTAVDISSNWLKFPRYGYLTKYGSDVNTADVISQLSKFHINGLQFYDWQDKHHDPIAGEESSVEEKWQDLSKHDVYKSTIEGYISNAHNAGMSAMQYNLIYGATQGYDTDGSGAKKEWGLYKQPIGTSSEQWTMKMPDGWETDALYFMDPSNKDWQNYIFAREKEVFGAFDFDGWHMDTVGDFGTVYKADGTPVSITTTFKEFLDSAKTAFPNKFIMMNPVGNKGHQQVNASKVDGVYTEIWDWDGFPNYNSLKGVVDQARIETNKKSLIVPAYMNYDYAKNKSEQNPGKFNTSSVLLTDASVLAAGGSRLELGDDTRMLCSEYFPNRNLLMSQNLIQRERKYYDFIVAYENLLRDKQINSTNEIEVNGYENSKTGQPNKIWTYSKKDSNYDVIQMINLLGVYDNGWRSADAKKQTPTKAENFTVKYYTTQDIAAVSIASPDSNDCKSQDLAFTKGIDDKGNYITFTVPSLEYWDMIYMKKAAQENMTGQQDSIGSVKNSITNPGFEDGLMGWNVTGTSYGLDSNDVYSGSKKIYFYNSGAYEQKIDQKLSGLSNGTYTVTAMVKQNTGNPDYAAMELTSGGETKKVNISHNNKYEKIEGKVAVSDGNLNIAFNYKSSEAANLQIDDIELLDGNGNVISKEEVASKHVEKETPQAAISVGGLVNGGFETGDSTGWSATIADGYGVNNEDAYNGNYKCYFWGKGNQKLQQTVTGIPNGNYTVEAVVKQNTGTPSMSRMELSNDSEELAYADIEHGDGYKKISKQVNVTDGKLTIAFHQESSGECTNLQIDEVRLLGDDGKELI